MTAPVVHVLPVAAASGAADLAAPDAADTSSPRTGAHPGRPAAAALWPWRGVAATAPAEALACLRLDGEASQEGDLAPQLGAVGARPALADAWCTPGLHVQGRTGSLHWRHGEDWLFGSMQVHEDPALPDSLQIQVQAAYLDLFRTLRESGFVHPVRLWNYIPRINAVEHGLERYRRFNIGRQNAFLQAGQAAFEGAPAACALGSRGGPVCIGVLASRHAPMPLENPRQISAYRYPSEYGPRAPTFSRATLADIGPGLQGLWLSGTASIVGHRTVHAGDPTAQTHETLTNIETLIDVARREGGACHAVDALMLNVYLRDAAYAPAVREAIAQRWGACAPALEHATFVQADICRADLLVEIEGHAVARCDAGSP